ncbi:hypothetical protein V5799_033006 [Amblyomma americanum]|uniref:Uncharacterized protein n=1 Tax=Amblyomma americanum TaxID=6943 RepID=A0AAQ4DPJ6_AMBAM
MARRPWRDDLRRCRDVARLLEALENRLDDEDVQQVFFTPSHDRLELLCWVLITMDPSGVIDDYLSPSVTHEQLRDRIVGVLTPLNDLCGADFEPFVDGTTGHREQRPLWALLLKTAEFAQRNE